MHTEHEFEHVSAPAGAVFIPSSMGPAERLAEGLRDRYHGKSPAACQYTAAQLLGHPDWSSVQAAVASGVAASRCDDEESGPVVALRREHQTRVARIQLAGIDAEVERAAARLDRELLASGPHTLSQRYAPQYNGKRLERARYAYNRLQADWTLEELAPTGRPTGVPPDDGEVELLWRVDVLPATLKHWLAHHRPQLAPWGEMIGKLRVRQRCATDLLAFAAAWAEFTLAHGAEVPHGLQVYPIALCARWYAWQTCARATALQVVAREAARGAASAGLQAAIREAEEYFLLGQAREDFRALSPSAREQQMRAGHTAVRRCMLDAAARLPARAARGAWLALAPAPVAPR